MDLGSLLGEEGGRNGTAGELGMGMVSEGGRGRE